MARHYHMPRQNEARRRRHIARMHDTITIQPDSAEQSCLPGILALRRLGALEEERIANRWLAERRPEDMHALALSALSFQIPSLAGRDMLTDDVMDQVQEVYVDTCATIENMTVYDPQLFRTRATFAGQHAALRVPYREASPATDAWAPLKTRAFDYLWKLGTDEIDTDVLEKIAFERDFPIERLAYSKGYVQSRADADVSQMEDPDDHTQAIETAIDATKLPEIIDAALDERAAYIIRHRFLMEQPTENEDLALHFNITVERVRQIIRGSFVELRAYLKGEKTSREIKQARAAEAQAALEKKAAEQKRRRDFQRLRRKLEALPPKQRRELEEKAKEERKKNELKHRVEHARRLAERVRSQVRDEVSA